MGLLDFIFRTSKPKPLPEGAVVVTLRGALVDENGGELPEFAQFEDHLIDTIESSGAGLFDCNEIGEGEATLFLYGDDAEELFRVVEPILKSSPVGRRAHVTVRQGAPGSPERSVQF